MATRAMLRFALVVALVALHLAPTNSTLNVCDTVEMDKHDTNIQNPLSEHRGNVVILVFGKASRYASHKLVKKMESKIQELRDMGMVETVLLVVAQKDRGRRIADWKKVMRVAHLKIDNANEDLFTWFDAKINDVVIFDRCGRMTYFIPYDKKNFRLITERVEVIGKAIITTYTTDMCIKPCQKPPEEKEDPDPLEELLIEDKNKEAVAEVKPQSTPEESQSIPDEPQSLPDQPQSLPDEPQSLPDEPQSLPEETHIPTTSEPPSLSNPSSLFRYVWSFVKSVFTLKNQDETQAPTTVNPVTNNKSQPIDFNSLTKQEACDKLGGPNPCDPAQSPEEVEYDAVCCDATQDKRQIDGCINYTEKYCQRFLLKQFCCTEP